MVNHKNKIKRIEKKIINSGFSPMDYLKENISDSYILDPSIIIMNPYFHKLLTKQISDTFCYAIGNLNSFAGIQIIKLNDLSYLEIKIY